MDSDSGVTKSISRLTHRMMDDVELKGGIKYHVKI